MALHAVDRGIRTVKPPISIPANLARLAPTNHAEFHLPALMSLAAAFSLAVSITFFTAVASAEHSRQTGTPRARPH